MEDKEQSTRVKDQQSDEGKEQVMSTYTCSVFLSAFVIFLLHKYECAKGG